MAYKLMAVDIDGTLVDSSGKITDETKKAIKLAVDNGLIFTICTGRPIQGVSPLSDSLGLDLPFITYNGAMVVMGKSRRILYEKNMSAKDAANIIRLGENYKTSIMVWKDNKLYSNELNEKAYKYGSLSGTTPLLIEDVNEMVKEGVTKILWYDHVETIQKYEKELRECLGDSINFHTSQPFFLEFVDKDASKGIALMKLGEHFGIGADEMIAVGDGFNDLSMIEYAGLGVAMDNAHKAIKEKADYITLSNDEDGVAHLIYKFILEPGN